MTAEEAVKNIETNICRWCTLDEHCEDCEIFMGEEALEKQIPKKVNVNGFFYAGCPNCSKDLYHKYQFCPDCGQALDWSEEEEP